MTTADYDAVIVGAGPNGLTAAARLAQAGRRVLVIEAASTIGGGSRTKPFGNGARYDPCAAVHPFGASSPAFEELQLDRHGLTWLHPEIPLAHPFDDGSAATLHRRDEALVGEHGRLWHAMVGHMSADWPKWRHFALTNVFESARSHPAQFARFALFAGLPITEALLGFRSRDTRALLAGLAAHGGGRLTSFGTAGIALALAGAAEAQGMPFAGGGSQSIVDALANVITYAGGVIETGRTISSLAELPPSPVTLLDVTPGQAASIMGTKPPRWRHGVAAWKLDLVLNGPMPWTADPCRRAGTVHLGGTWRDISRAESQTVRGTTPPNPFVIVAQPSLVDHSRAPLGQHVIWAYRHVPNSYDGPDATAGIEQQFDRFAPGWRDLVVHQQVTTAMAYSQYNLSYEGGDIAGGAMTLKQTIARPRVSLDPYRTTRDGVWLCSQSTAPGPGVHGMCGWHAAGSVLKNT